MDKTYYRHSVELDVEKCRGCTACLKRCPTEAIRIHNGKSEINADRCIDCGECIRVCPHNARRAMCSKMEHYMDYKYKIALPAPVLFGQFPTVDNPDILIQALLDIGFDDVFETAQAAELVSEYTRLYLKTQGIRKPVISSACPVVARLISMRFPYLKDNLLPILPPMEVGAILAKKRAAAMHPELKSSDIGVFFISPCAAKVSYIRNGFGDYKSNVDVVISVNDIYFKLLGSLKSISEPSVHSHAGRNGIGWASSGGESNAILDDKYLAADGIENIIDILEKTENGSIPQLEFIELNACIGGCVGGVMTIENPFIAKTRLQTITRGLPDVRNTSGGSEFIPEDYILNSMPDYEPITKLGSGMGESIKLMAQIQTIKNSLPGIDCGASGSPTCRAFAEDIVKGTASADGCAVKQNL